MADAYTQAINVALADAKGMLGKNEVPNHSEIVQYLHDGGQDLDPHKVAWCAAFVSASLQKAGLPVPTQVVKDSAFGPGAYAPNYLSYGSAVAPKDVQAGDILVANNGSHVGFAEGPIRQGPNGPEVQLIAGNERDPSGQYRPGSYTNPTTGAVANRAQVGMVGERWVPLNQYSARRYVPTDDASTASAQPSQGTPTSAPSGTTLNSAPASLTMPASAPNAGKYQPLIDAAAAKYNLDPAYLGRLLKQESNFDPNAKSPAGAQGIAQFMPATAKRYGVDPSDPASSIDGAAHYLSDNIKLFNGNIGLATAGYNWGEGNVQKWQAGGWNVPKETQNYVQTITGHSMDEWKTGTPGTTLNASGASGTPAGGVSAPAGTGQPAVAQSGIPGFQAGSPADKSIAAAAKTLGLSGGQGQGQGQGGGQGDSQPEMLQARDVAGPAMASGGGMMLGPGGQNTQGQRAAQQMMQQRGFLTQPSTAAFVNNPTQSVVPSSIASTARPAPLGAVGGAGAGLPGTTLNSPSLLQSALMTGYINPYDYYAGGGAQFGSS